MGVEDVGIVFINRLEGKQEVPDISAVACPLFFCGVCIDADSDSVFDQKAPSPETATRIVLMRMMMSIHSDQFLM